MSDASQTTTDHDQIRRWAQARDASPATVAATGDDASPGVLTLDVEGYGAGEDQLEHISWDAWFEKFEAENLAFLHQDTKASGETSTFFKLVAREA